MKYQKMLGLAMSGALALSLGLTACGGGQSASTAESTTAETLETMTEGWTTAYMGVSDAGETYYYAESEDGSEGVLCVLEPESGKYISFVGTNENDADDPTIVTLTDTSTGNSITYQVTASEDGVLTLDLGDVGTAKLEEATIDEVIDAWAQINDNGEAVA